MKTSLAVTFLILGTFQVFSKEENSYLSMFQLAASPSKFDGERRIMHGFFKMTTDYRIDEYRQAVSLSRVYLTRDDMKFDVSINSIVVQMDGYTREQRDLLNGKYVIFKGEFSSYKDIHSKYSIGNIYKLDYIQILED